MSNKSVDYEFWEANFREKEEMWGDVPAASALLARDFFIEHNARNILIPGFGYGRNAKVFKDYGLSVTGIEISETAITLSRKHFPTEIIFHGSVCEMPFNNSLYDGIFCYGLLHLLNRNERKKFIRDCFNQLSPGGVMFFTTISHTAETFGKGKMISRNRFNFFGINMFFYDEPSIESDFKNFGLINISSIDENYPFFIITCRKSADF